MRTTTARRVLLAGLSLAALPPASFAQSLLRDINSTAAVSGASSSPRSFVPFGTSYLFTAEFPGSGRELAITDGTTSGTLLVADILAGPAGSDPKDLTVFGSHVYFSAIGVDTGRELWRSDGTAAGTELVIDLFPGVDSGDPLDLEVFQGELYFGGRSSSLTPALWKTDGTAAGVTAVHLGSPSDRFYQATAVGPNLFYVAYTGSLGSEVWFTQGTPGDQQLTKDIEPNGSSYPYDLFRWQGKVFFTAERNSRRELWRANGHPAGTFSILPYTGQSDWEVTNFTPHDGLLYFHAENSYLTYPSGLWRTDGTVPGTEFVAPMPDSSKTLDQLVSAGDYLYFSAYSAGGGNELWRSDGTAAGTVQVADLFPGPSDGGPNLMRVINGELWLEANIGDTDAALFVSDGTAAGTVLRASYPAGTTGMDDFVALNGEVLGSTRGDLGTELWKSDGVAAPIELVKDILPSPLNLGSSPHSFRELNGKLVFLAYTNTTGEEPWVTDGTAAGTLQLADTKPGPGLSTIREFVEFDNRIFFFAGGSGEFGTMLWSTDGTPAGTALVPGLPASPSGYRSKLYSTSRGLFFNYQTATEGFEPWIIDPGSTTPRLLADLTQGTGDTAIDTFVEYKGLVYFVAEQDTLNPLQQGAWKGGLFATDGTAAGTTRLTDGVGSNHPVVSAILRVFDGKLFFTAHSAMGNHWLWETDGTMAGTQEVFQYALGPTTPFQSFVDVVNDRLVFADDVSGGNGVLWGTDGTAAGTEMLAADFYFYKPQTLTYAVPESLNHGDRLYFKTSATGDEESLYVTDGTATGTELLTTDVTVDDRISDLTAAGDHVYFVRKKTPSDYFNLAASLGLASLEEEIWKTDGTAGGTTAFLDFDPDNLLSEAGPSLSALGAAGSGGELLIGASNFLDGLELWLSDGSPANEVMLADVNPGIPGSSPGEFHRLGDSIVFRADDGQTGAELWSLPLADTGGFVIEPFGSGCAGANGLAPEMVPGPVARIGQPISFGLRNANPNSFALLFFSPQRSLSTAGTCNFYLGSPLFFIKTVNLDGNGKGSFTANVSNDPTLLYVPLYFQFFVGDVGPVLGSGVLSDGLEVLLGS